MCARPTGHRGSFTVNGTVEVFHRDGTPFTSFSEVLAERDAADGDAGGEAPRDRGRSPESVGGLMIGWIMAAAAGADPVPIPGTLLEESLTPESCRQTTTPTVVWRLDVGPLDQDCSLQGDPDGWFVVAGGEIVRFDLRGRVLGRLETDVDAVPVGLTWQEGAWIARETGVERVSASLEPSWFAPLPEVAPLTSAPVVGQLDEDPALEVAVAGTRGVVWLDDDGSRLGSGWGTAPPLIAAGRVVSMAPSRIGFADAEPWMAAGFYERSEVGPLLADTRGNGKPQVVGLLGSVLTASSLDGSLEWLVRIHVPPRDSREGWSPISLGPVAWSSEAQCLISASSTRSTNEARAVHCTGERGVRWRQPLPGTGARAGVRVADADGRPGEEVLVAVDRGEVWGLDLEGRVRWTWRTEGLLTCPLAVARPRRGRPLVLVGTPAGLVALRPGRSRGC